MRVLFNLLSAQHLSGRHVVHGFLKPLLRWTRSQHEVVLLHYAGDPLPEELLDEHVSTCTAPSSARHWLRRSIWESTSLDKLCRQQGVDRLLTASGGITPSCRVPQYSLAQNPWCYANRPSSAAERLKAALQRHTYRRALYRAEGMFFISRYLRDLYRRGADLSKECETQVAYVGLDAATHAAAAQSDVERQPDLVVAVSAMARWKRPDVLVRALDLLRRNGASARLRLVGPWPEADFRSEIEALVDELGLRASVEITGMVSRADLHRNYAEATVFSLMSECESFGIPAAEAMAFGTPIVASRDCAISEICDGAGLFGPSGDPQWTADALSNVLTDRELWSRFSIQATESAGALTWDACARPLMRIFGEAA